MSKQNLVKGPKPEETSEDYDLTKSESVVGQLYPILLAKDGEIIDGLHRNQIDRNWKRVRLEHIDTEEKKLVARLVANKQVESKEQVNIECINGLAEIHKRLLTEGTSVRDKIAAITGLSPRTVGHYLEDRYKLRKHSKPVKQAARVSASQRIENKLGKTVVERHEEEIKEKLLQDKNFIREVARAHETARPIRFRNCGNCGVQTLMPKSFKGSTLCPLCFEYAEQHPQQFFMEKREKEKRESTALDAKMKAEFWRNYPNCQCQTCGHYKTCEWGKTFAG